MIARERSSEKFSLRWGVSHKTLWCDVFFGGLAILQRDRISDRSAYGVKSGDITGHGGDSPLAVVVLSVSPNNGERVWHQKATRQ